jgi:hypothetical protein
MDQETEIQSETSSELNPRPSPVCRRVEILFEFSIQKPTLTLYRAVRSTDGYFRMEKRGKNAKKFRPAMWCGSEESLLKFKEAVEFYMGK